MVNQSNFYSGANYGLDSSYGATEYESTGGYKVSAGDLSMAVDPRTANQLKEVFNKISTGAKNIEVQGISPEVMESIPEQHLTEINRLKKLTGMNLTFHGPILEPTGLSQQGWSEAQREQTERQMWSAVERSHKLDPDGNLVVTFHSSALPEFTEVTKPKKGELQISKFGVINERTGDFGAIPLRKEYLREKGKIPEAKEELERHNKQRWESELSDVGFLTQRADDVIESSIFRGEDLGKMKKEEIVQKSKDIQELFKWAQKKPEKYESALNAMEEGQRYITEKNVDALNYADAHARNSYLKFQNMFNEAYENAEKYEDKGALNKLDRLRKESTPIIKKYEEDPSRIIELTNTVDKGLGVLGSLKAPTAYRPIKEFAIDKASDTFSNIALNGYKKFKDTAPIISIENPPANQGLARAEDLRSLVKESRKKFVKNAVDKMGMSESSAKKQAEKLIGVTWDVGHINMIRKFGYDDKDVVKETKKIAPFVKHVHLSDNFGLDHTELPMGMGNVPTDKMLAEISKFNNNTRKVIEAGNWYEHFQTSPLTETLEAFNSPIYSMKMAPSWGQAQSNYGGYFSGYGKMLPEKHFEMYGAGFSNLPTELGGQMSGTSRVSGAPIE